MIKLFDKGAYLLNGTELVPEEQAGTLKSRLGREVTAEEAKKGTIAYGILKEHNKSANMEQLNIKFDALTSHDITYVGIIQTARASGMDHFPMPYILTCCHNSLCAWSFGSQEIWRYLRPSPFRGHPSVYARNVRWLRQDDPWQ